MKYPDFQRPFYLITDASITHIGAELYQIDEQGKHVTLGFISRTLYSAERKYCTTELELLAIVYSCNKFRPLILGHTTYILTDHKALAFLKNCRLLNAKLIRWTLKIQDYGLVIQYISGKENIGADTLTRYPQTEQEGLRPHPPKHHIIINKLHQMHFSRQLQKKLQNIEELQRQDDTINKYRQLEPKYYLLHDGILFGRRNENKDQWRLITPVYS